MPREVAACIKSRLAMERNILSLRVRVSLGRLGLCDVSRGGLSV